MLFKKISAYGEEIYSESVCTQHRHVVTHSATMNQNERQANIDALIDEKLNQHYETGNK